MNAEDCGIRAVPDRFRETHGGTAAGGATRNAGPLPRLMNPSDSPRADAHCGIPAPLRAARRRRAPSLPEGSRFRARGGDDAQTALPARSAAPNVVAEIRRLTLRFVVLRLVDQDEVWLTDELAADVHDDVTGGLDVDRPIAIAMSRFRSGTSAGAMSGSSSLSGRELKARHPESGDLEEPDRPHRRRPA